MTLCVGAIVTVALVAACARGQRGRRHWGFEEDEKGETPRDWSVSEGHVATVTAEGAFEGRHCALLTVAPAPDDGERARRPGTLTREIPADEFADTQVRFRAAVRVEGDDETRAQLWLQATFRGGRRAFFDDMAERPITDREWTEHEIVGVIDRHPRRLTMGVILNGDGKVWLDDVSLQVVAKVRDPEIIEPPSPLTVRGLRNVTAFTRLLGLVRFFHPSDEAAAADWDALAIEGMRVVEGAGDAGELCRALEHAFAPVAPTLRAFETAAARPDLAPELAQPEPDDASVVHWDHTGWAGQKWFRSERVYHELGAEGTPDPADPFVADLGGGVSCVVPVALYADDEGTLPQAHAASERAPQQDPLVRVTGDDRATRLAAVALAWNVFHYFYPYFDTVGTDWEATLEPALLAAAVDEGELAFLDTLRRLVAQLHDGHGFVSYACNPNAFYPPVQLGWIEDRVVVTAVPPGDPAELKPGDAMVSIDDRPVDEAMAAVEELVSSPNAHWRRERALWALLRGPENTRTSLGVQRPDGTEHTVTLVRGGSAPPPSEPRPDKLCELEPGVMYVDLTRVTTAEVNAALSQLEQAKGIVFDMRGYPSRMSWGWIGHVIDEPVQSPRFLIPRLRHPADRGVLEEGEDWQIQPEEPRLTAKTAILADARTISRPECDLAVIEHYGLMPIVGAPTGGTNGSINPFVVPGGYYIIWTGVKVLKRDGSQHHGIGIRPTVPVAPTIAGIAAGRDEVLERALEVVNPAGR